MVWWLLLSCVVNEAGPPTPGSAASDAHAQVVALSARATRIEGLATELEAMTDTARAAPPGPARQEQIAAMRALMADLATENDALQTELRAIEGGLHTAAGDPTLVPDE